MVHAVGESLGSTGVIESNLCRWPILFTGMVYDDWPLATMVVSVLVYIGL